MTEMQNDCIVLTADNYDTAEKLLSTHAIDILITDIKLPSGNGLEFIQEAKGRYPQLITIVLTNYTDPFFRKIAEKSGADFFFDKSMEFEKVLNIIKKKVDSRP